MATYERLLTYDIQKAIELRAKEKFDISEVSQEELIKYWDNYPANIPHHPLLLNYDWVYENVEQLFCIHKFDYQKHQGVEEYYMFFKVMISKYPIALDYEDAFYNNDERSLVIKWGLFASNFVSFFGHAFDERLISLLEKEDFRNYFLNHPLLFNLKILEQFSFDGMSKLLEYEEVSSHYTSSPLSLIYLIKNNLKIEIPSKVMLHENVIKEISHNPNVLEFYYHLIFIEEQVSSSFFIEEHKIYCDFEINHTKNGILPLLEKEYEKAEEIVTKNIASRYRFFKHDTTKHIFNRAKTFTLPKIQFYQELSKYIIIGLFISRYFEAEPYNLLIDIETLYKFAIKNNRFLKGAQIYEFLMTYENKSVFEILEFYKKVQNIPLKEILYDDWQKQHEFFIEEINSKMINLDNLELETNIEGISYYDITNLEEPILVHNTSTSVDDTEEIQNMIEQIKTGYKERICLSLQDKNHQMFYSENEGKGKKEIKFVYGKLQPNRVGIVYHTDAYSQFIDEVEDENYEYKRQLYTIKDFLKKTNDYNEINYLIYKEPFIPIGILCEEEITKEEIELANELNCKLFLRKTIQNTRKLEYKRNSKEKYYSHNLEHRTLFK